MLQAVIFDADGLLIDTEWPDYVTWREAFQECGGDLPIEWWVGQVGVWSGWQGIQAELARLPGAIDLPGIRHRRRERYVQMVRDGMSPLPGVRELIDELVRRSIPRGVASASDRDWVSFLVEGLELRPHMGAVVTRDDVKAGKPAPDVYLRAAELLGADPAACVALEDSATGIAAARAAGMRCVAVPNQLTRYHDLSAADARVESLAEVTVDWLARLLP